jgi:hypothetical protein
MRRRLYSLKSSTAVMLAAGFMLLAVGVQAANAACATAITYYYMDRKEECTLIGQAQDGRCNYNCKTTPYESQTAPPSDEAN